MKLSSALPAALLAGVLLTSPLAAAPRWTALGPYGGFVDTLTVDPVDARVLYATADVNGTFKSVDGGPQVYSVDRLILIPDPAAPGRLYAATRGGIWVLEDQP